MHVQDGGLHKRVGEDSDFLWSRSPLSKVDDIRIPVLVAPRRERSHVQRAESEQIVAAMKERGIDHEYAMYENEGHGYHRTDRFLAKHLGGRAE